MDNQNEFQDSLNPDESGELKTDEEVSEGTDTANTEPLTEEQLAAELAKVKATNAKLYARAKKAEEALKEQEGRKDSTSDDASWKARFEFMLKHKDLDDDQIEYLSAFAKGKGIALEEALKDKLVQKTIEADKQEKRIANATPEGKSQSPQYKDLRQQLAEATDRETHKKLWQEFTQGQSKGVETE